MSLVTAISQPSWKALPMRFWSFGVRLAALILGVTSPAAAQPWRAEPNAPGVTTEFVHLANDVPGAYYTPAQPKNDIALFYMHAEVDYLENVVCKALSARGYRILCANASVGKASQVRGLIADRWLLDAAKGVAWLRTKPGVNKVIIMGHSGGGAMMSAYAAISEAGLSACQGPEKIIKCSSEVANLPKADGVILLDANYGLSTMTLLSLDASVTDERDGQRFDPALDLWSEANGFSPSGAHYSADFAKRWFAAVNARNNRLIDAALTRLQAIQAGTGAYVDDEPFDVPGGSFFGPNNKFFSQDTRYLAHTKAAWPLLHKDGKITVEIVHSVRLPAGLQRQTQSYMNGAEKSTVLHYLGQNAVRTTADFAITEDGFRGIQWASSYNTPVGNAPFITKPLLTMGMTGNWEYLNAELIYNAAGSKDKTVAFVEGATHPFYVCKSCEKTPGEYGDTVKTLFDYVDQWLSKPGRF